MCYNVLQCVTICYNVDDQIGVTPIPLVLQWEWWAEGAGPWIEIDAPLANKNNDDKADEADNESKDG